MTAMRLAVQWPLLLVCAWLMASGPAAPVEESLNSLDADETAICEFADNAHTSEVADCTALLQVVTDVHFRSAGQVATASSRPSRQVSSHRNASSADLATPHALAAAQAHDRHSARLLQVAPDADLIMDELVLALVVVAMVVIATAAFCFSDDGGASKCCRQSCDERRACCCCWPFFRICQACRVCFSRVLWLFSPASGQDSTSRPPTNSAGGGAAASVLSESSSAREAPLPHGYRNNLGRPPREDHEVRLNFVDGRHRIRSVTLLLIGSMSALLGFLLVAALQMYRYRYEVQRNIRGDPFKSGYNYFPGTLTEQIHEPRSAEDKIFLSFGLFSAVCLILSWYPWELRNVYVSNSAQFLCCSCLWLNVRQYMPPLGLLLISCVSHASRGQGGLPEQVSFYMNVLGMMMWVCGYILAEVYTLYFTSVPDIRAPERKIRKGCIIGCMLSTMVFGTCDVLTVAAGKLGICCTDSWHVPNSADVMAAKDAFQFEAAITCTDSMQNHRPELFDTAHGTVLAIKFIEYGAQLLASIFICASLLAIWWYCPERSMDICENIDDVDEALLEREELGHSRFAQALAGKMPRFPFLPIVRQGQNFDTSHEMSCSHCGTVFVPDSRFCDSCGAARQPIKDGPG